MQKTLTLEGNQVTAVSNALLPRLYRVHFGTDILMDLQNFQKEYQKDPQAVDFTPLENLTWLMLKEGGEEVGESPEEWLRTIDSPFSVYELGAEILQLWRQSQMTTSKPKKK